MPLQERFPGHSLLISQGILNEIKGIASGNGRYAKYAKVALEIIKKSGSIDISDSRKYPDDWMLDNAYEGAIICTNDSTLKMKLKKEGAAVISISMNGVLRG